MSAEGATYSPEHDGQRLGRLLDRVRALMRDGRWRTLAEIQKKVGGSEASVSARLRDLRKEPHGSHVIDRRRRGPARDGLHEYRMVARAKPQQQDLFGGGMRRML